MGNFANLRNFYYNISACPIYYCWLGGSVVERRSLTGELAPNLQLVDNHVYG